MTEAETEIPDRRLCDEDGCSSPAELWVFIEGADEGPDGAVCHSCADERDASEETVLFVPLTATEKFARGERE